MAMTSAASTPSRSDGLCWAPFTLDVYHYEHKNYLDTEKHEAMPSNGDSERIYDTHNGLGGDTALWTWSRRWDR